MQTSYLQAKDEWQNGLLNLSLSNALLSYRGEDGLPCRCSMHEGFRLINSGEEVPAVRLIGEMEKAELLEKKIRAAAEDGGSGQLYAVFAFFVFEGNRAPLLLLPVGIKKDKLHGYRFFREGGLPMPNPTLRAYLKREYGLLLPDFSGDLAAYCKRAEATLSMQGRFKIERTAVLSVFGFARFLIWRDLEGLAPCIPTNPILKSLAERKNLLPSGQKQPSGTVFTPFFADSTQREAIALAESGETFVLQGAPGTGKSQTVANLIANAVAKGKRVLFVSQKRAAIDVVYHKLCSVGLGDFCLKVADFGDLKGALEGAEEILSRPPRQTEKKPAEVSDGATQRLNRYGEWLTKEQKIGYSVLELIGMSADIRAEAAASRPDGKYFEGLTRERFEEQKRLIGSFLTARERSARYDRYFAGCRMEYSEEKKNALVCYLKAAERAKAELLEYKAEMYAQIGAKCEKNERLLPLMLACKGLSVRFYRGRRWRDCEREFYEIFSCGSFIPFVAWLKTKVGVFLRTGIRNATEQYEMAKDEFSRAIGTYACDCDAFLRHIDSLCEWCEYRRLRERMHSEGLWYLTDVPESKIYQVHLATVCAGCIDAYCNSATLDGGGICVAAAAEASLAVENSRKAVLRALERRTDCADERAIALKRRLKSGQKIHPEALFNEFKGLFYGLYPCFMMTPNVLSGLLSKKQTFDIAVLDECSQIPTAEAVCAIARAKSAVLAGDPMQMPPTGFFKTAERLAPDNILDECIALGIRQVLLGWHYRSTHESLIAFSNAQFYGGRLCTLPSCQNSSRVRLVYTQGVYSRGTTRENVAEAEKIADLVTEEIRSGNKSIGVVAFSSAQQTCIERILRPRLAAEGLSSIFEEEEPLFIRNLESVQGDERSHIFCSVGYGRDASGKFSVHFGPLNQQGGERRLNVALTRARDYMTVVSSVKAEDFAAFGELPKGVRALADFLEFAEKGTARQKFPATGIARSVGRRLGERGYFVECGVGLSHVRIDVALSGKNGKRLGILIAPTQGISPYDSAVTLPCSLQRAGWHVFLLDPMEYYRDAEGCIGKIMQYASSLGITVAQNSKCGGGILQKDLHSFQKSGKLKLKQKQKIA